MPKHTDNRVATFNIPLIMGADTPVAWHDEDGNDDILCEYVYGGRSTLVNTSIRHSCLTNTGHRLFLAVGGWREPFEIVREQLG